MWTVGNLSVPEGEDDWVDDGLEDDETVTDGVEEEAVDGIKGAVTEHAALEEEEEEEEEEDCFKEVFLRCFRDVTGVIKGYYRFFRGVSGVLKIRVGVREVLLLSLTRPLGRFSL